MSDLYHVSIVHADGYEENTVNAALNSMFDLLGMDPQNPFAGMIQPGMTVFIKPNWAASRWRESCDHIDTIYSVITHPLVIEAVADRVAMALNGRGELIIGDNPTIDADFEELMGLTQIKRLENKYDVPCKVIDMRPLICTDLKHYGKRDEMVLQKGDPRGEIQVNLGKESLLYQVDPALFRAVFDEREETIAAHSGETQLYTYGRSLYDADVYISIPKLKTHHKVGATLNLKGLVGAATQKNQLVHWRIGCPEDGGDEYPARSTWKANQHMSRGGWSGNDTIWRTVVDLYHGLLKKKRRYFSVVDGIIGGEGQGPLCPYAKNGNILLGGENLLAVDVAAVRLMGFSPRKIPYLKYLMENGEISTDQIQIHTHDFPQEQFFYTRDPYLDFRPSDTWEALRVESDPE